MPYSVELRFDETLARQVLELWQALDDLGVCPLPPGEAAPHVSLAVYEEGAVAPRELVGVVDRFAARRAALPIAFPGFGVFPGVLSVLFLAPVATRHLLEMHAHHHALASHVAGACWSHYRPGSWVPHCTLGMSLPLARLQDAIGHLREHWSPLAGTLRSVALIRAEPAEVLHQRPLAG